MADYCTLCADQVGFPVDIDVRKIAETLEPGTYVPVLCEGCGMNAVGKDENGQVIVHLPENVRDDSCESYLWVPLEDFERDHSTKYWYHAIESSECQRLLQGESESC